MGFIKSFVDSAKGTLADQWKDYLVPMEGVPATAGIFPAVLHGTNAGRGSNTKGSENIISNGSKIIVPEGMALITLQDGAITGCITEAGGFIYTTEDVNAKSIFAGDGMISSLVKQSWDRFKFGGQPGSMQTAVYVNLKEIPNNRFGTTSPIQYYNKFYDQEFNVIANGTYTLKIVDPILFIKNFVPVSVLSNGKIFDFADIDNDANEQLFTEVVYCLDKAFSSYILDLDGMEMDLNQIKRDGYTFGKKLSEATETQYQWKTNRGLEIVNVAFGKFDYDESSRELIEQLKYDRREINKAKLMGEAFSNNMAGMMAASSAEAMKSAATNKNGAMMGFMGMNMANQAAGNMMGAVQQPTQKVEAQPQEDPYEKLAKFKKMLDDGLITQEEYDEQKKKILGV